MKKLLFLSIAVAMIFACSPKQQAGTSETDTKPLTVEQLKTADQKVSYALGYQLGNTFNHDFFELDKKIYWQAFQDGLTHKGLLDEAAIRKIFTSLQERMTKDKSKKMMEEHLKNDIASKKWLAEIKAKPGIKADESGLLYKVVKAGKGASPTVKDTVVVQYRGTLPDGKEFDSSYKRGKPATFPLNRMVKGWQIGIPFMKKGAKYEFWIPSDLAYGKKGAGKVIGPGQAIKFEVELIDINPKAAPAAKVISRPTSKTTVIKK
ncbi:FKBP-type peptidyl-prolyl cis-trans isomerase [bacterium]|nr:FKBP-type peptidyl-prolyl cis-trans isomerase [bacterium]